MNVLIPPLHNEYCARTGMDISMNMMRERVWNEWLMFNREVPFTLDDLKLVIGYLRSQIKINKRNDGALKFTNLIGAPDRFEEDLQMAKAWRNDHRNRMGGSTATKPKPQAPPKAEDNEVVSIEDFEAFKAEMAKSVKNTTR